MLAGCSSTPSNYNVSEHRLKNGDRQLTLEGKGHNPSIAELKEAAQREARKSCDGPFLLRDNREETYSTSGSVQRNRLRVEVECVT